MMLNRFARALERRRVYRSLDEDRALRAPFALSKRDPP
jgi:hypothetical protein